MLLYINIFIFSTQALKLHAARLYYRALVGVMAVRGRIRAGKNHRSVVVVGLSRVREPTVSKMSPRFGSIRVESTRFLASQMATIR